MAYKAMDADACYAFCDAVARPAIVSTVRRDGRPHAAPVWYVIDGQDFVFTTGHDTLKGRNLRRDARVSLCIQDDRPPFSYVLIEGSAMIDEDPGAVRLWATRIGGRYMGRERADEYGERNGVPGEMLVRVKVDRIRGVRDVAGY